MSSCAAAPTPHVGPQLWSVAIEYLILCFHFFSCRKLLGDMQQIWATLHNQYWNVDNTRPTLWFKLRVWFCRSQWNGICDCLINSFNDVILQHQSHLIHQTEAHGRVRQRHTGEAQRKLLSDLPLLLITSTSYFNFYIMSGNWSITDSTFNIIVTFSTNACLCQCERENLSGWNPKCTQLSVVMWLLWSMNTQSLTLHVFQCE